MSFACKISFLCVVIAEINPATQVVYNSGLSGSDNVILFGQEQCILTLDSFVEEGLKPLRIKAFPTQ